MKNERLKKLCVFTGDDWVDVVRIHVLPHDGATYYIVHHMEEEDLHAFGSVEEALEFIKREYVDVKSRLHIGECP